MVPSANSREGTDILARWASAVAHEVRNPLAGIRGAVQIIGDRLPPGSPETEVAREILSRIDALDFVLEELLRFARPGPLKPEAVAVQPLLQGIAQTVGIEEPGRPFISVEGDAGTVHADPALLERAIIQLVRNAAEAAGQEGRVILRIERGDGEVRIHVDDSGPGIEEDYHEAALTPFHSTRPGRHGLGLPTAHRIALSHGGDLLLTRSPEGGARVTFLLPVGSPD